MTEVNMRQDCGEVDNLIDYDFNFNSRIRPWPMRAVCMRRTLTSSTRRAASVSSPSPTYRSLASSRSAPPGLPQPPSKESPQSKRWRRIVWPGLVAVGVVVVSQTLYEQREQTPSEFDAFVLVKREPVSPTASIFYLEAKDGNKNREIYQDAWKKGIWNFQFKQPQIQVVRRYTPLPPLQHDNSTNGPLRFLIRNERNGEVSNWLHRLPAGSQLELRGPNLEYEIGSGAKHLVFLAGGTGVASALQAAYAQLASDTDSTVSILWANRRREDCIAGVNSDPAIDNPSGRAWIRWFSSSATPTPAASTDQGIIVRELDFLKEKFPHRLEVDYFVDAEHSFINKTAITRAISKPWPRLSSNESRNAAHVEIVVSGPDGFIAYLAGPRIWRNGKEEQGPISGVVQEALLADPRQFRVWKV